MMTSVKIYPLRRKKEKKKETIKIEKLHNEILYRHVDNNIWERKSQMGNWRRINALFVPTEVKVNMKAKSKKRSTTDLLSVKDENKTNRTNQAKIKKKKERTKKYSSQISTRSSATKDTTKIKAKRERETVTTEAENKIGQEEIDEFSIMAMRPFLFYSKVSNEDSDLLEEIVEKRSRHFAETDFSIKIMKKNIELIKSIEKEGMTKPEISCMIRVMGFREIIAREWLVQKLLSQSFKNRLNNTTKFPIGYTFKEWKESLHIHDKKGSIDFENIGWIDTSQGEYRKRRLKWAFNYLENIANKIGSAWPNFLNTIFPFLYAYNDVLNMDQQPKRSIVDRTVVIVLKNNKYAGHIHAWPPSEFQKKNNPAINALGIRGSLIERLEDIVKAALIFNENNNNIPSISSTSSKQKEEIKEEIKEAKAFKITKIAGPGILDYLFTGLFMWGERRNLYAVTVAHPIERVPHLLLALGFKNSGSSYIATKQMLTRTLPHLTYSDECDKI